MENTSSVIDTAGKRAAALADDVSRRARDVAERAAEAAGRASQWVREQKVAENAAAYVSSNPAKALGVALIAGALLAFLFTRKKPWP